MRAANACFRMKLRKLSLVPAAILMLCSSPAASARVAVPDHVRIDRGAHGFWRIGPPGAARFTAIGAFVWGQRNEEHPDSETLFGGLFRMRCVREQDRSGSMTMCAGTGGVGGELDDRQFQMDPLMRAATLELEKKGRTYRAEWASTDVPTFYSSSEACVTFGSNGEEEERGEGEGGGTFQPASATVDAFGRELTTSGEDFFDAFMETGLMITECDMERNLQALERGDFSALRFRFAD